MQVNKILSNNFSFGRKLTENEKKDYNQNTIRPALEYLGTEEVSMILHGTSFPEDEYDIGVGSPYGKIAAQLIPFELLHGFNSIQLGPIGELSSKTDVSPYRSSVGSKNYLFIDMNKLTQKNYGNLLDANTINKFLIKTKNTNENFSHSDFPEAFANYNYLIGIAYKNFDQKLKSGNDTAIQNLNNEYKQFMRNNNIWKYGVFDILANIYGTDDFTKWNKLDANLISLLKENNPAAKERLNKILTRSENALEKYCFGQFILDKQIKENTKIRQNNNFKYISDMLVGFSPADEWINSDLFLKNYKIGCPYGGPYGGIQKWNVPILDPKKLFNSDGSLGPAGKYLKTKLDDALNNFDNVRIDHALGLVDPYIYDNSGSRQGNIGRMPDLDPDKNYQKVLEKIILPTLEEHGLDKDSPVWEDLVTDTPEFNYIYHEKFNLPGITQLEFKKAEGMEDSNNWTLIGSHDSAPAMEMIKENWVRYNEAWNPMYLAGVLNAAHDSREYCNKIDKDDSERVKAKFAELFMMGKKIQISFADFFGINQRYNEKGNDSNPNNWKLRMNRNYEDSYYKNLSSDNPTAMNIPEILKLAVKGKADMNIIRNHQEPEEVYSEITPIIEKLEQYEKILKEKE